MARWADLFDEALIVVDCVVRSGAKTTRVAMQPEDTVGDLCDWLERTEDLPHDSFVLSQDSNFLRRKQQMQSLEGSRMCVLLHLVGRPCSLRKDKENAFRSQAASGDPMELQKAAGALSADARRERLLFGSQRNGQDYNAHSHAPGSLRRIF
jgi:hypothetical protein